MAAIHKRTRDKKQWHGTVTLAPGRLRQEDGELQGQILHRETLGVYGGGAEEERGRKKRKRRRRKRRHSCRAEGETGMMEIETNGHQGLPQHRTAREQCRIDSSLEASGALAPLTP